MDLDNYSVTRFNPDRLPHAMLKDFNEFIKRFEFYYITLYPVPPKNAIDCEIEKWQSQNRNK